MRRTSLYSIFETLAAGQGWLAGRIQLANPQLITWSTSANMQHNGLIMRAGYFDSWPAEFLPATTGSKYKY